MVPRLQRSLYGEHPIPAGEGVNNSVSAVKKLYLSLFIGFGGEVAQPKL
jgi:hypothetical protein